MKKVPIVICAGLISVLCLSGYGASLPQEEAEEQIPVYLFEEKPEPGIDDSPLSPAWDGEWFTVSLKTRR